MSTTDQARALMVRHQHLVRNRENCLLSRAAAELGMPADSVHVINGKARPDRPNYENVRVGLS